MNIGLLLAVLASLRHHILASCVRSGQVRSLSAHDVKGRCRHQLAREQGGPDYRRRLRAGYLCLFYWICSQGWSIKLRLADTRTANKTLVAFLQAAYEKEVPYLLAKHAILAVQNRHRRSKGKLRQCWNSVEAWGALRPFKNKAPCPFGLWNALC